MEQSRYSEDNESRESAVRIRGSWLEMSPTHAFALLLASISADSNGKRVIEGGCRARPYSYGNCGQQRCGGNAGAAVQL